MKEIKFRAWDGKEMLQNVGVHPHLCSDLSYDDDYYKENKEGRYIIAAGFESYKLMQYTGLKDKSGKEIYEGDIVKHKFRRVCQTEEHISTVVWDNQFCCYYLNDGSSLHRMRDDIDYEIIGNLYENSELLK